MRADRLLIGSILFLGTGVGLLVAWCHGNVGFNFAVPVSGTKFNLDMTTMGAGVLAGLPLAGIGLLLLAAAFISAILAQFRRSDLQRELDDSRGPGRTLGL
jgi:hypothetical protein